MTFDEPLVIVCRHCGPKLSETYIAIEPDGLRVSCRRCKDDVVRIRRGGFERFLDRVVAKGLSAALRSGSEGVH